MILIASADYITAELLSEMGRLPPSFLPLGNRRLYEHQVTALRRDFPHLDIYLSLPDGFSVSQADHLRLDALGASLLAIPEGFTLGESLLYALNTIGRYEESLRLLHGDTLLANFPLHEDLVALSESEEVYPWEIEAVEANNSRLKERIWCGYFSFGDVRLLVRELAAQRGNFVKAVRSYQATRAQDFPVVSGWHDLGHVNTYYRSRSSFTTQRAFNTLLIKDGVARKSSKNSKKIEAEWRWFQALPPDLKRYTPQPLRYVNFSSPVSSESDVLDSPAYELEYLANLPLNELYVYGALPASFWIRIFDRLRNLLENFKHALTIDRDTEIRIRSDFVRLVVNKTNSRLKDFSQSRGIVLDQPTCFDGAALPSLNEIAADCQRAALALLPLPAFIHGDLCLSNLLFDSRSQTLKIIDPRGLSADDQFSQTGDLQYDVAKLTHSVIGLYDHVIADRFELEVHAPLSFNIRFLLSEHLVKAQNFYISECRLLGLVPQQTLPLTVLLFLSMLPLHADAPQRQMAFLANALRLYKLWRA